MIKNSTYIRRFTDAQRNQLTTVATEQKLKTVPDILFFTLEKYLEQKLEIARLHRIIQYKQKKMERLQQSINQKEPQ